jgi:hypothetical protein
VSGGYGDDIGATFDEGRDMSEEAVLVDGTVGLANDRDANSAEKSELAIACRFEV